MDGSLDLRIRRPIRVLTLADLESCKTLPQALSRCAEYSGMQDKSIAIETGIDNALWSRIKSGDAGTKWDFEERLMDACGNELPLLWRLYARGYKPEVSKRETELQQRLREAEAALAARDAELDTIKKFVRDTRAAA